MFPTSACDWHVCDDGECSSSVEECDGEEDCRDGSDEEKCGKKLHPLLKMGRYCSTTMCH